MSVISDLKAEIFNLQVKLATIQEQCKHQEYIIRTKHKPYDISECWLEMECLVSEKKWTEPQ